MPADGLNVGTSTFGGGVSQTITKENIGRISQRGVTQMAETPRGLPPELKDPKFRGRVSSLNPMADRAPPQESNFPLRAPAKSSPVKPIKEEQKVATTTGGDGPGAPDAKRSDSSDDTPYREPEVAEIRSTTEQASEAVAPSATAAEVAAVTPAPANDAPEVPTAQPAKSFVQEVRPTATPEVKPGLPDLDEVDSRGTDDLGPGMPRRSVYTPPEFLSPPEGTHPRRRPAPPQLTGWRSLAATTSALILGLYFGLQLAAVIAPSSLNFSVILGILLILMGERDGLFYRAGGVVSKLAKPFSIFSFTSGVSLITSSLIVNNLMVELHPNWAKPLLDALIR